jgi:hypothetical protein
MEEVARLVLLNINVDSVVSIVFVVILLIFYSIKGGKINKVARLRSYYTIRNIIKALNSAKDIVNSAEEIVNSTKEILNSIKENA